MSTSPITFDLANAQKSDGTVNFDLADAGKIAAEKPKGLPKISKDMSDDDIIRSFGYDPAKIKQSPLYHANLASRAGSTDSRVAQNLLQFSEGAADAPLGILQLITHAAHKSGLVSDSSKDYVDLITKLNESNYQHNIRKDDKSTDFTRGAGNVAAVVAVPGPETFIGRAALGGAMAAANPETGDTTNLLSDKAKQAVVGAALGGATEKLVGLASKGISKGTQAIRGARQGTLSAADQQIEDLAAQHAVPMTAGDVSGNVPMQKAEQQLEQVPFSGMGKFRQDQQSALRSAASSFLDTAKNKAASAGHDELQLIEDAAAKGNKGALALKEQIANAGDDYHQIIKNSGSAQVMVRKLKADDLYGKVEKLASDTPVPLQKTAEVLKNTIGDLEKDPLVDKGTLSTLRELQARITAKGVPEGAQIADTAQGKIWSTDGGKTWNEVSAPLANTSFQGIRQAVSKLGDKVSDAYKGTDAVVGTSGARALQGVKEALRSDLDTFAQSGNPELKTAWQKADSYYKQNVVPFKAKALAAAFSDETLPDQIYRRFITSSGTKAQAQQLYSALDDKGRAAVRTGIISEAFDKALNEGTDRFSPVKFASAIRKTGDANGVFFKGYDKAELDGFTKLMDHMTRAGQYAENPPTGQRAIPFLLGGFAAHNPVAGGAAIGLSAGARKILTTKEGRRLLLSAASAAPGSPTMNKIAQKITEKAAALTGVAVGDSQ